MNNPIYFVTGASGFVGRSLCRYLTEIGARVHALVRREDVALEALGVRVWTGDLWDENILAEAMHGAAYVIHCAGDASFGNGPQYFSLNVNLTEKIIMMAKKQELLRRFVFVSSIGAIDRSCHDKCKCPLDESSPAHPSSDYGRSKWRAEKLVAAAGLPFSIVRPSMVVGEEMRQGSHFAVFARQAIARGVFARIAWTGVFSVVHVDDLARALHLAAVKPDAESRVIFCAGEQISLEEFFEFCSSELWRVPMRRFARILRPFAALLPFSIKALLFPALVANDARLRALGWEPSRSVFDTLKPLVDRERARLDPMRCPGGQSVVTGAASGLGRALVGRLARKRKQMLLVDRDAVGLAEVVSAHPNCRMLVADLSTEQGVHAVIHSDSWRQYPVTEFFSCAGLGRRGWMQEISSDEHRKMFEVNVLARIEMAQHVIAEMIRKQFGRIIFISSSSAFQPLPYMATYAATNAALLSIGESWHTEISDEGIDVMTVCPGGMQTKFQNSAGVRQIEGECLMPPEDVADKIMNGLRDRRMTLIVSTRSFAMSLLARALPRKLTVHLWRRLMEKMR